MQFRLRSKAILSLFAASFLLVGTRTAGAATATATVNGEVAAEAILRCMLVDRDPIAEPSEAAAEARLVPSNE